MNFSTTNSMLLPVMRSATTWRCASRVWKRFDVEEAVKSLVHRRCGGEVAPQHLRAKIVYQMTVIRKTL